MAARKRTQRQRIADMGATEHAVYQARRSARLARAGVFVRVTPEDAEDYAQRREEDADIIEGFLVPEARS